MSGARANAHSFIERLPGVRTVGERHTLSQGTGSPGHRSGHFKDPRILILDDDDRWTRARSSSSSGGSARCWRAHQPATPTG